MDDEAELRSGHSKKQTEMMTICTLEPPTFAQGTYAADRRGFTENLRMPRIVDLRLAKALTAYTHVL